MLTDDRKKFFEKMFIGFANALFAGETIYPMHMVVKEQVAEVMPAPPKGMETEHYISIIAAYAKQVEAEFITLVFQGAMTEADKETLELKDGTTIECLTLFIGTPGGKLYAINGVVEKADDGTPYVQEWKWVEEIVGTASLIPSFDD